MARDLYIGWAALYEGRSDMSYFNVIIPRIIEDLIYRLGKRHVTIPDVPALLLNRGSVNDVAKQLCESGDAFVIAFIHADTGGRAIEKSLERRGAGVGPMAHAMCEWPIKRCILIAPRHEMEAWAIADADAVCDALGYRASPAELGLPSSPEKAERIVDPKAVLEAAIAQARGRRARTLPDQLFPSIAQRQSLSALRKASSFKSFEAQVQTGLASIGAIPR
jgi:hypothetical protein